MFPAGPHVGPPNPIHPLIASADAPPNIGATSALASTNRGTQVLAYVCDIAPPPVVCVPVTFPSRDRAGSLRGGRHSVQRNPRTFQGEPSGQLRPRRRRSKAIAPKAIRLVAMTFAMSAGGQGLMRMLAQSIFRPSG